MRLAVDIGGTFTDLTAVDDTGSVFHAKRLTTNDDLSRGVAQCVDEAGVDLADAERFLHGSTIAINTVIQRDGAATARRRRLKFRCILWSIAFYVFPEGAKRWDFMHFRTAGGNAFRLVDGLPLFPCRF